MLKPNKNEHPDFLLRSANPGEIHGQYSSRTSTCLGSSDLSLKPGPETDYYSAGSFYVYARPAVTNKCVSQLGDRRRRRGLVTLVGRHVTSTGFGANAMQGGSATRRFARTAAGSRCSRRPASHGLRRLIVSSRLSSLHPPRRRRTTTESS